VAIASIPALLPLNARGATAAVEKLPDDTPSCGQRYKVTVFPLRMMQSEQVEFGRAFSLGITDADVIQMRAGFIHIDAAVGKSKYNGH